MDDGVGSRVWGCGFEIARTGLSGEPCKGEIRSVHFIGRLYVKLAWYFQLSCRFADQDSSQRCIHLPTCSLRCWYATILGKQKTLASSVRSAACYG
jgi:hypothetical protein